MYNYAILLYNLIQNNLNINDQNKNDSSLNENQENIQMVIQLLKQAAENGCDEALSLAAHLMVENQIDLELAAKYAEKASSKGDINAKLLYATLLLTGKGIPKDIDTATAIMSELGTKGMSEAYYQYGVALDEGIEVQQSHDEAIKYFKKAADLGNESAQLRIDE